MPPLPLGQLYSTANFLLICGLKWKDIKKTFQVRRTHQRLKISKTEQQESETAKTKAVGGKVKTDKGSREIPIQDKIFTELLEYKERQRQEKKEAIGAYKFNRFLKLSTIEHANFHSLCHTFATQEIESGVPIKAASDILGHATVQLTMDLYCHS